MLLDSGTFKGTGVTKMAVTVGKSGKVYFLNANNLGGYKLGPGQTDGIVQTIVTNRPVFGGAGSYPGEGGYVYITPVGYPTYAYKIGFSGSGVPVFSQVGATKEVSAGRVGVGIPTITSLNGKAGSAILWMCDPDAGLRAWYAVPQQDGTLKRINLPQVNGLNKFQRPAFGDTRLYVTDPNGNLYCLGSPVNLPLTCTSPVDFGDVALGSKATKTVSCTANIGITSISDVSVGDNNFKVNKADLPQGAIAKGATFTFPVTWDLTETTVSNQPNASYGNTAPGVKSTALKLTTVNAVAGYSTQLPVSLTGNEVSQKAFFVLAPISVDFGGLVILDPNNPPTNSLPFTMSNKGLSPLTISGYAYTQDGLDNPDYTNVSFAGGAPYSLDDGFTSSNLPTVGTVIQGGGQISVQASFSPINGVGAYKSYFTVFTTGGSDSLIFESSASTAPIANFSISTAEGGWLPPGNLVMDFGSVAPGSTSSRQIRICNNGGSVLQISKSKPPNGIFRPEDPNALHESQNINVGDCAYATVLFVTNAEGPNIPDQSYELSWTLNTDDLNFGVHVVDIKGTVVSKKVGPTNSTGNPVYTYLGCYSDTQPGGRLLPDQQYADANNNNGRCQTACQGKGTVFAGTEYQTECYCGNTPPPDTYKAAEVQCNFACSGDGTQNCGGPGGYINIYYDATRYTPGSTTTTPGNGGGIGGGGTTSDPVVVQTAGLFSYLGCYTEATQGRALSALQNPQGVAGATLTVETCAAACKAYTYMGVEYSGECYCSNTLGAGSVLATGTTPATNGCNMVCNGNKTEYCGGANRLNAYKLTNPPTTPTDPTGPITVTQLAGYTYLGCYSEATQGRALSDKQNPIAGALVSVESCKTACAAYTYFGVEYSGECYCGNKINTGSALVAGNTVDVTQCNMLCNANATEYCGGPNRLNMYQKGAGAGPVLAATSTTTPPVTPPAATTPSNPQTVGKYAFQGCYSEATGKRALTGAAFFSYTLMTIEMCATNCQAYTYFGVEFSGECYCGNSLNAGSVLVPKQTDCNFLCPGNKLEYCGAGDRLDLYKIPATAPAVKMALFRPFNAMVAVGSENATSSTHMQSIMIASAGTAGSNGSTTATFGATATGKNATITKTPTGTGLTKMFASSTKTNSNTRVGSEPTGTGAKNSFASSTSTSSNSTVTSAPTGSGLRKMFSSSTTTSEKLTTTSHSMIGTGLTSHSSSTSKLSSTSTNSTSATSTSTSKTSSSSHPTTSEITATTYNSTQSATSHSSTKTSATSSAAATYTPEAGKEVNGWTYLGCSNTTSTTRALPAASKSGKNMTVEACQEFCSGSTNNYGLAGLQNGKDCYCGNGLQNYAALGAKGCDSACSGNKTEFCGGESTLSVYNLTSSTIPPTPVKQVGYYLLQGCYPASVSSDKKSTTPLLSSDHTFFNKTGMTVEACVEYCWDADFSVAGLDGGYNCTCAKSLPTSGAKTVDLSKCNLPCVGNSREFCGAYQLVNVYEKDSSSVNEDDGEAKTCNQDNSAKFQKNGTKPVKRTEKQYIRGGRSERLW